MCHNSRNYFRAIRTQLRQPGVSRRRRRTLLSKIRDLKEDIKNIVLRIDFGRRNVQSFLREIIRIQKHVMVDRSILDAINIRLHNNHFDQEVDQGSDHEHEQEQEHDQNDQDYVLFY